MFQRYLERIEKTADFLARTPHPDQALDFLSAHASPFEEVAVALRAVVDHDGVVRAKYNHSQSDKKRFLNCSRTARPIKKSLTQLAIANLLCVTKR